jgi:hypothetical protein
LPPGTECTAYLHLKSADEDNPSECTLKSGDHATLLRLGSTPGWRMAHCTIGDKGFIELALLSGKGFGGSRYRKKKRSDDEKDTSEKSADQREKYVGVIAIAIAPTGDQAARQRVIDQIVPQG